MSSSVGRNSLIMASGTAASRITGQIRTILLAAAIGTTGLAANAYQAGSMIPQVIYTLVSGGIFNAVLVPHIVRTLKADNAEEQLNKIVTFAVTLLAAVTVLMGVLTPWITRLYVNGSPELISLTCAFTLWCTPQIFFYGLYTVLGQILAVKNRFGAYAWSSVGANVISCIGFTAFIMIFGNHAQSSAGQWTTPKIALTAGAWTLGVAFQAIILFIPLFRLGFRFHWKFGVRGIGLRTMGPIAAWSLGIVVIDQIANIITTRVLTGAPSLAERTMHLNQFDVAGNATYQNAYTIYMLPYSLIAVSVATAIFPQISQALANRDMAGARDDLSRALRTVGTIMCFFTAAFIVMPLAITRSLLPTVAVPQAILMCGPLMGLSVCLPLASAYLIIQRTFYAFEDGRSPFTFMLIMYMLQLGLILTGTRLLPPTQWAGMIAVCVSAAYLISFIPLVRMLRRRFDGSLDGKRIAATYAKAIAATVVAVVVGLGARIPVYAWLHVTDPGQSGIAAWLRNVLAAVVLGVLILIAYIATLWVVRSQELLQIVDALGRRLHRAPVGGPAQAEDPDDTRIIAPIAAVAGVDNPDETRVIPLPQPINELEQLDPPVPSELAEAPIALTGNGAGEAPRTTSAVGRMTGASSMPYISGETMRPHLGDTVLNRYTLVSPLREEAGLQAWKANDRVLSRDCQLFIVSNKAVLDSTNALAGTLASSKDARFTPVIQLQHDGQIAVVLTQLDAGVSLTEYMHGHGPLSYEAMRTIIAEATAAIKALQADSLTHHALSTDTVRLTRSGVQLADTPVSEALADTSNALPGDNPARRAIRQLAGVLYGMLTRTPSTMNPQFSLNALPADTPTELRVIVKRGLELPEDGTPTVPLVTLAELEMLLGPVKQFPVLTRHDLRLTGVEGACSIVRAMISPALPADILPIPESLASSQTLPTIPFAHMDVADEEDIEDEELGAQTQALNAGSLKALWSHSKALMEGEDYTGASSQIPELQPEDATEMFSAFDPNNPLEPPLQPQRMTVPIDVSKLRDGSADPTDGVSATGRIPIIDSQGNEVPNGSASQRALEQERADIDATYAVGAPALPPSFAPQNNHEPSTADKAAFEERKSSKTKKAAIIVVIVAVVVALGFAVHSIATTGSLFGINRQQQNYWPNMDLDDVPFGQRKGNDVESPQNNATPEPTETKTETPKPQNTTAYPVASQTFLDRPNGQQGYGYYLHLEKKEDVSRIVVKIRSSGGKGYVRVNTAGDPTAGEQVAEFTFADGGTTEVKFTKPVDTQDIVMWVPMDSLPGNQLFIDSVQAF